MGPKFSLRKLPLCPFCFSEGSSLTALHNSNGIAHRIGNPCFDGFFPLDTHHCPFYRQRVTFAPVLLSSACHLAPAVNHCFNPYCIYHLTSLCWSCARTLCYLNKPSCPSSASPRPILFVEQNDSLVTLKILRKIKFHLHQSLLLKAPLAMCSRVTLKLALSKISLTRIVFCLLVPG